MELTSAREEHDKNLATTREECDKKVAAAREEFEANAQEKHDKVKFELVKEALSSKISDHKQKIELKRKIEELVDERNAIK